MIEIERKWTARIVNENAFSMLIYEQARIFYVEQSYLPYEAGKEVRIRRAISGSNIEISLTVKEGSGLSRKEVWEPISSFVFKTLFDCFHEVRISKRRFKIDLADGHVLEIDEFIIPDILKGQVMIEVEFKNEKEAQQFDISQLGLEGTLDDFVERTGDKNYSNYRIAKDGQCG